MTAPAAHTFGIAPGVPAPDAPPGAPQAPLWSTDQTGAPLSGLRVVDFGQYIAGPLTAMLLADQGADIIRIDPPGGPRWNDPANAALLRGRRSITLDLKLPADLTRAQQLCATADVVIENFRPGVMDRLGVGAAHLLRQNPGLVFCSLPGFSQHDPRAAGAAWEGVVMAAGGGYVAHGMLLGDRSPGATPLFSPLPLASVCAGMQAATGIVAALLARDRDGYGQHLEVPLFEALCEASGVQAMSMAADPLRFTNFGSGVYRCADGRYVTFVANWLRHLDWFLDAAGCAQWRAERWYGRDSFWGDPSAVVTLRNRLVALFATRTAAEWETLGHAHGCSLAMLRSVAEFRGSTAASDSGTLGEVDDPEFGSVVVPGAAVRHPRTPVSLRTRPAVGADTPAVCASLAAATSRLPTSAVPPTTPEAPQNTGLREPPLRGVRVLDLSRVVAAPTTARLLAQLGADVVTLDVDPEGSTASFEEPLFHHYLNRGKRSVVADLKHADGQRVFAGVLARSDVLVQNFTAEACERLGTGEGALRRISPHLISVYLNAYGTTGPWAHVRGYAELANVVSGLTHAVRGAVNPVSGAAPALDLPRWMFTDSVAGLLGAFGAVLGLFARARTGAGGRVETSLLDATMWEQIMWIVTAAGEPAPSSERDMLVGGLGWSEAQRVWEAADGWVFVGGSSHRFARFAAAHAAPGAVNRSGQGADNTSQFAHLSAEELCRRAQRAGLGAHRVETLAQMMAPGGAADRLGLRLVDTSERHGQVVMPGPGMRFSRTPMVPGAAPAPFGAESAQIQAEAEAEAEAEADASDTGGAGRT